MSISLDQAEYVIGIYGGKNGYLAINSQEANENYGNHLDVEQDEGEVYLFLNSGLTMDYDSYAFRIHITSEEQLRNILDIVVQK